MNQLKFSKWNQEFNSILSGQYSSVDKSYKQSWYITGVVFVLFIVYPVFQFPSLLLDMEVWAETGTNYFYNAQYKSLFQNLNISDSGYLPLFPRLIALFYVKVLGLSEWFPFFAQATALLMMAVYGSFFCLPYFRVLIASDYFRAAIALFIGIISNYQQYTFINFPYFGFAFCLFSLIVRKDVLSNKILWALLVLNLLTLASKPSFLLFLPVYAVLSIYTVLAKNKKGAAFSSACLCMLLIQVVYIHFHKDENGYAGIAVSGIGERMWHTVYAMFNFDINSLFRNLYMEFQPFPGFNFLVFAMLIAGKGYALYALYKRKKIVQATFILLCTTIALTGAWMNISVFNTLHFQDHFDASWSGYSSIKLYRWNYFPVAAVFLAFVLIAVEFIPWKAVQLTVLVYLGFQFTLSDVLEAKDDFYRNSNSNWSAYKEMLKDSSYYIPVNPSYPWAIRHRTAALDSLDAVKPELSARLKAIVLIKDTTMASAPEIRLTTKNGEVIPLQHINGDSDKIYYYYLKNVLDVSALTYYPEHATPKKGQVVFVVEE